MSVRRAAQKVLVAPRTLRCGMKNEGKRGNVTTPGFFLTEEEQFRVCKVLQRYALWGRPQNRNDLKDTIERLVNDMPSWRKKRLRFKNSQPGDTFCRVLERCHSEEIKYAAVQRQTAMYFGGTNAEVLTSHFAGLELLIKKYNIDPLPIVNVDETGVLP